VTARLPRGAAWDGVSAEEGTLSGTVPVVLKCSSNGIPLGDGDFRVRRHVRQLARAAGVSGHRSALAPRGASASARGKTGASAMTR
jgi:hypothetical protein